MDVHHSSALKQKVFVELFTQNEVSEDSTFFRCFAKFDLDDKMKKTFVQREDVGTNDIKYALCEAIRNSSLRCLQLLLNNVFENKENINIGCDVLMSELIRAYSCRIELNIACIEAFINVLVKLHNTCPDDRDRLLERICWFAILVIKHDCLLGLRAILNPLVRNIPNMDIVRQFFCWKEEYVLKTAIKWNAKRCFPAMFQINMYTFPGYVNICGDIMVCAVENGNLEFIEIVLNKLTTLKESLSRAQIKTVLHKAAEFGYFDTLRSLLVFFSPDEGLCNDALLIVVRSLEDRYQCVKALVPYTSHKTNEAALFIAAKYGLVNCVVVLLDNIPDIKTEALKILIIGLTKSLGDS